MGVTVAVTRVACATSTGTQDITTTDLGGLTPTAALFVVSMATADATAAAHALLIVGATDGTRQWTAGGWDEDAQASSDSGTYNNNTACVVTLAATDGAVDGSAAFSAWLTNGVRINWTDAPPAAYLLTVIFFAGTDVAAYADGELSVSTTVNTTTDITTPGFRPDVLLVYASQNVAGSLKTSFGLVHENGAGTVTARSVGIGNYDNQATTSNYAYYATGEAAFELSVVTGSRLWYLEAADFDANGFSVITRAGNPPANRYWSYLALSFGGAVSSWVGTHTTPTSTGNNGVTAPGFTPQFVMMLPSLVEAAATSYSDGRAGVFGLIAIDGDEAYCTTIASEDNAADSNTQSLSSAVAVAVPDHAGTLDIEASFVSFDATGWTLNYSNVNAAAKLWPALAIGAAGGTTYNQAATGSITPTGATVKATGKPVVGSLTPGGALVRAVAKVVAGALTPSGVLSTARGYARAFTGAITPSATLVRATGKTLAGSLTPAATLVRDTARAITGSLTPAATLVKQTAKAFTGSLTPSATLTASFTYVRNLAGSLTPSGALVRSTGKALAGALAPSGSITRAISKALAGALGWAGALSRVLSGESVRLLDVAMTDAVVTAVVLTDAAVTALTLTDAVVTNVALSDATRS